MFRCLAVLSHPGTIRPSTNGHYCSLWGASAGGPGAGAVRGSEIRANPDWIRHRFGTSTIGIAEMLRCARDLGLKAQSRVTTWKRLVNTPLPAIAGLRDGGFLVLGKVGDDKALVQSPLSPRPAMMTREEF